jgi:hypothetical protein
MTDLEDWVQRQRNDGRTDAEIRTILERKDVDQDTINDALTTTSKTGFIIASAIIILFGILTTAAIHDQESRRTPQPTLTACNTTTCLANTAATCGPTTYERTETARFGGIQPRTTQTIRIQPVAQTCELTINHTNISISLRDQLTQTLSEEQQRRVRQQAQASITNATQNASCTITVEELTTRLNTWDATNHSLYDTLPQRCTPNESRTNTSFTATQTAQGITTDD